VKKVIFLVAMTMLVMLFTVSAAILPTTEASTPQFLYVANDINSDYFQFDAKGVYVAPTSTVTALKEGWIVLSGQEPVTIKGPNTTIVLQRESILTIGSTTVNKPSYYLIAGSASFLMDTPFLGKLEVSTPVGIYTLQGHGEMFISSDYAEIVFSLGGKIRVMNAITRQITDLPEFTYLNLADPFVNTKELSRETYETLSINPKKTTTRILPSVKVQDGITFQNPEPLFKAQKVETEKVVTPQKPTPAVVKETPKVAAPVVKETPKVAAPVVKETPKVAAPVVKETPKVAAPVVVEETPEVIAPVVVEETPEVIAPVVVEETPEVVAPVVVEETPEVIAPVVVEETPEVVAPVVVEETPEVVAPAELVAEQEVFDVYVVHTNDVLGQIEDEGIGYARLATLLDWGRSVSDRNLLLDAGNTTSGTPLAEAFKGETVAVLLDMLGYNAIAPGPADYAYGIERLQEAANMATQFSQVKILAANILDSQGEFLFDPYGIFDLEGYTIGVIGISVPPKDVSGISYLNETIIAQAQNLVDEVASQSDFVILLGNTSGAPAGITSTDIAQAISGIDLIIDGEATQTPARGKLVGSTLIVNANARLQSVGVVAIHVVDGEAVTLDTARISVEDINNPNKSALAKSFGITHVPLDSDVVTFIEKQKARYAAQQIVPVVTETLVAKEPALEVTEPADIAKEPALEVTEPADIVETPVVVEGEPAPEEILVTEDVPAQTITESPLAIKQPLGITASVSEAPADSFDWGLSATLTVSRDSFASGQTPKLGLSINPFFNHNAFAMGLQAFFLTDGSLLSPSTYDVFNLRSGSGIATTVSSAMSFLDYIRYGQAGDAFYLLADDTTPIAFGNRILVNNLGVASGPYEEHLGLYSSATIGKFGLELFADDLYFSNWLAGDKQIGGMRVTYAFSPAISLGASSLLSANSSKNFNAYPALDLLWTIKNERRLRIDAFVNMATMVSLDSFSLNTIYNSSGSSLSNKLPNFLAAGGLDLRTLNWNYRLVGAVQNSADGILSLGSLNQSHYSGKRMLDANAGIYFTFGAEARYTGDTFSFSGSWYLPIEQNFSRIIPLDTNSAVSGDMFAIEATYTGSNFEAALGLRRVGFVTAITNLFDFSGGFSGFVNNTKALLRSGGNAQPYVALRYQQGLFSIFGDASVVAQAGAPTVFTPRFNFGATVTVAKRALAQSKELALKEKVFSDTVKTKKFDFSADLRTAYTKTFTGGLDNDHITVQPVITLAKGDSFSFGLGPKVALDLQAMQLYAHDGAPFSFGSSSYGGSTIGKVYDITTDLFSLIDHLTIGKEGDAFTLAIGRDQTVSMGPMVKELTTRTDSTLQDAVGLQASFESKAVDVDLFMNNLAEWQLGGFRLGIAPFKNYGAEFGLSALGNLTLTNSIKRIDFIPTIDMVLPVIEKEHFAMSTNGSFSTMLGYDRTYGFEQLFYDSSGSSFFNSLNNYLVQGGLKVETQNFMIGLDVAMQKGALSYGMFNPLFIRERSAANGVLASLDSAWPGSLEIPVDRTFSVGASSAWRNEYFDLAASYILPFSTSFAANTTSDLLMLKGSAKLGQFDISLGYNRRGFMPAAKTLLTGSAAVISRIKTFLGGTDSVIHAGVGVSQGPLTFNATISTLADLTPIAGAWNRQSATTSSPAITFGVDINLF